MSTQTKSKKKIFTDKDRLLLRFIEEFYLTTRPQLERLMKTSRIWDSLLLLENEIYYLDRGSNLHRVYSTDRRVSRRSEIWIPHELMITDIHIDLYLSGTLDTFSRTKKYGGNPNEDARATLKSSLGSLDLYVEADTGSMRHPQMRDKLERYLKLFETTPNPFKVLFVCKTLERAQNLAKMAESLVTQRQRRAYLFTTLEQLPRLFGPICLTPYGDAIPLLVK
jgi:hypothetical protein